MYISSQARWRSDYIRSSVILLLPLFIVLWPLTFDSITTTFDPLNLSVQIPPLYSIQFNVIKFFFHDIAYLWILRLKCWLILRLNFLQLYFCYILYSANRVPKLHRAYIPQADLGWADCVSVSMIFLLNPTMWHFCSLYPRSTGGGILLYLCPSVLPSVLPSVRPSVRPRNFSSHFSQQLLMAEIWYLVTSFI